MEKDIEKQILALGTYEILEHRFLKDIGSKSFVLRHKKSGARIALLPNEDPNKVFYIAFRTPPEDSTGVAHIIEHTVLCGSRDFPVKDPFIEVVKGSLNTFLNAMTYPDKTVYPVASTNEKDFANLMHVYLDAVFHPNIYTNENIFRQEGWHYEVREENPEKGSELAVNGVVYNEMKGVMSSPDDVLNDEVLASLYPDTTYSIVSGGDPLEIPKLTYEKYLDFHRKFYHPSNSYLYLYGNMDVAERLAFLDEKYLSQYEPLEVDSEICPQEPFAEPVEKTKHYSILKDEDPAQKSFLSWNVALPIHKDPKEILAFKVLDYVLCDAEGAPVKEALRKKEIGQTVESLYESGIYEPYYSIAAKYADPEQKDEFVRTIRGTLEELSSKGLDPKAVLAGINYYEFHYREADFGSYPKGLIYGLDVLDTWLYDEKAVWTNLDVGAYFDELKEDAGKGYFEGLIRKYLLQNPHASTVLLLPEQGLTEKVEAEQREKLDALFASLSGKELDELRQKEEALRTWQNTEDSEEALQTIPVLERKDLSREAPMPLSQKLESGAARILGHPAATNGIDYLDLSFDVTDLLPEEMKYLGVFKVLMGALSTQQYSYQELDNEINIVTGGMTPGVSNYCDSKDPSRYHILFELSLKAVNRNLEPALQLAEELLLRTDFSDTDRIREVLEEERASMKAELPSSGHLTAMMRASAGLSRSAAIMDELAGIGAYRLLDELCRNFDAVKDELAAKLQRVSLAVLQKSRFFADLTAEKEAFSGAVPLLERFAGKLQGEERTSFLPEPVYGERKASAAASGKTAAAEFASVRDKSEGFTTAGQVQFVCRAGDYRARGLSFHGALRVLKVILGYDYLWNKVRVLGGAYGCMSGFGRDGIGYLVSYRDPKLKETLQVFKETAAYIRNFEADERTMTKYVIGAVSTLDRPMTPSMFGRFSKNCALMGLDREDLARERAQVLDCTQETIRGLAPWLEALEDGTVCVVGSAAKLQENAELFDTIAPLT